MVSLEASIHLLLTPLQFTALFKEHQNASQGQSCEDEVVSPENTEHETEDASKTSEL
jgi:hypothetical protein